MRKILSFLIMITLILAGCSAKEHGEIREADTDSSLFIEENAGELLFDVSGSADVKCDTYYDYHGGMAVPYPEGWELRELSPNYTAFLGENAQISISHNMVTGDVSGETSDDLKRFLDSFKEMLTDMPLYLNYDTYYRRSGQTTSSITIISREPLIVAETYDNIRLSDDAASYVSHKFSEKRYYINYNGMNTIISVVSKDKMYDLLDYVISGIRSTPIKYDTSKIIEGVTFPGTFTRSEIEYPDGYSYTPYVNDAYSGCFIQVYSDELELDNSTLDGVFQNAFGINCTNRYNNGDTLLFRSMFDSYGASISTTINTTAKYGILARGNAYNLEIYSNENRTVVIGYPLTKAHLMEKLKEE